MDKIGDFEILSTLHSGSRPLYRAKGKDGKPVAIKTIKLDGLAPELRERFLREAEVSGGLDHPNLVKVHSTGEAGGVLYLVMDLLDGADLSIVLADKRPLTWEQKLSIMEQVCDGLAYAHERGFVHRDLKPANLFLEDSGRVRILDFGMARMEESKLTAIGMAVGTLNYMAPEQVRGEQCTAASDVFSAGLVFFELATGTYPFARGKKSVSDILTAILFEALPSIDELAPGAPEGLQFVLNKALEKERDKRLQSAADLKQTLSLCRITLQLSQASKRKPAAESATPDVEAADSGDQDKTVVLQRVIKPRPEPKPEPLPASDPARPKAPPPELRYCTSCAHGNPKTANICARCGLPLGAAVGQTEAASEETRSGWLVPLLVVVVVLLLLLLLLWVSKD